MNALLLLLLLLVVVLTTTTTSSSTVTTKRTGALSQHNSIPGSGSAFVLSTVETAWRLPG
jgi:hypothetical protein